jgi:hypothetical protein
MKKILIILGVVVLLGAAGAYYYFHGKEFVVRISQAQLQEKLNAKLPLTETYLFIIDVTLTNPRVHLVNGSERINGGLDVVLDLRWGKDSKQFTGTVDFSGGIKYMPEEGKFFLIDPVIDKLEVQGVPDEYAEKVKSGLTKALTRYYSLNPVYSLQATSGKELAAKFVLKKVVVENGELVLTLGL